MIRHLTNSARMKTDSNAKSGNLKQNRAAVIMVIFSKY